MLQKPKIHFIKVQGIKCTNCAGKISKALNQLLEGEETKISVNVMQQNVTISSKSIKNIIPSVIKQLQKIGYPAVGQPVLLDGGQSNERQITVRVIQNSQTQKIQAFIRSQNLMGIISLVRTHIKKQNDSQCIQFSLTYDPSVITGRQISNFFERYDQNFIIINSHIQSFKNSTPVETNTNSVFKTGALCAFFLIFNMILPFTGNWYKELITFPKQLSIFAFSVILNLILSGYVFYKYTRQIVNRAFTNYRDSRSTDMETLIALGCLSAFALSSLFFVKYGLQMVQGGVAMPSMAVMDINDALTSASIIVLVVNIGKHLQHKVKRKILTMTESIFPESILFSNMKNRNLMIQGRKIYDSTVLQKGDIICLNSLQNSRLLLDIVIISGIVRAQQSTTTGNDQIIQLHKGDRIQSGALIFPLQGKLQNQKQQCLAQVENVFEKSMLVQIGTQIKFSQNQSEDKVQGIQAVCKSIANVFVKSVIFLSILTMVIWAILIKFKFVHLEEACAICWIVQRGIGVLVASCPCALGLAVPSVIAIVLNLATKSGILIKNNGVFQKMKITKKISFDKTGTLFTRISKIQQYHILSNGYKQNQLWQIIALLQKQIRHPLAQILYKQSFSKCGIKGTNFNFILLTKVTVEKQGISAQISNKLTSQTLKICIGNKHILTKNNIAIPKYERQTTAQTQLFLTVEKEAQFVMRLNTHSNLRPQAVEVVRKIMQQGSQVHILSGDSKQSVIQLAASLKIPLNLLHPQHSSFMKMKWIKDIQQSGKQGVMMIGDGLNDIPCLQQSSIGVSINAKSQLNINAADVIVLQENLYKILALIRLLKKGNLFININLFWAFGYNIIIMPIVAGVFYNWDIWVSPIWSSIAMSLSSIIVVSISHLLSFFTFDQSLGKQKSNKMKSQSRIVSPPIAQNSSNMSQSGRNIQKLIKNNNKSQKLEIELNHKCNTFFQFTRYKKLKFYLK